MALLRRRRRLGHDGVIVPQPGGVLVTGKPGAVESIVSELTKVGGEGAHPVPPGATQLAVLATTLGNLHGTRSQYLRLSERSRRLVEQHGLLPTGRSSVWGVVRDRQKISGWLDFEAADLGPEQMLSVQTAAVSLALSAAVKEVQVAIERVEGKIDDVLGLMRAERVGDVLGTWRTLHRLVERARTDGRISETDWSSVAALGAATAQDIEGVRAHIRVALEAADGGWRPGERAKEAAELFDSSGLLTESLALLIVAEDSLSAWHELRIAHVRCTEPDHLSWTLEDAQVAVATGNKGDQAIVDALHTVSDRLTTPLAHDGLAPWQRPELEGARVRLDELTVWFADQRTLDVLPLGEVRFPTAKESFHSIVRDLTALTGPPLDAARRFVQRSPSTPGLDPGEQSDR